MLHMKLSGSARERGLAQGEAFRAPIRELLELSKSMFLSGVKLEDAEFWLDRMRGYTREHEPGLVEEMDGVAAGAGISAEDAFLLNAVSAVSALGPQCTNVALPGSSDGPLLAKTSDIGDDYRYYMLQETETEDGERFIGIGWVGSVWLEVGLNARGLAVGQSSGPIAPKQDGFGLPTLIFPRPLLEQCGDVTEALRYLDGRRMAGKGLSMMLLDSAGGCAVAEKSGKFQRVREVSGPALYCTNHFVGEGMAEFADIQVGGIRANSLARYAYLSDWTASQADRAGIAELQQLLRSHEAPICQHGHAELSTHYAYVIAPAKREFMVTDGHPCEQRFQTYRL